MLNLNGNYIEFIQKDAGDWKEMYFNGINTYAEVHVGSYEDTSYMSDPEAFCKEYMKGETDPFNSKLRRKPKSKYIDMKIKQCIAEIAPHLLIN